MSQTESQSLANHARIVPGYHYGVLGAFAVNLLWSLVRLYRVPGVDALMGVIVALGLLGLSYYQPRRSSLTPAPAAMAFS